MLRILLVDDEPLVLIGLQGIFAQSADTLALKAGAGTH